MVIGYGGWDDILLHAVGAALASGHHTFDILWCFFSDNEESIVQDNTKLLERLQPGIARDRVSLFKGINATTFLPFLFTQMMSWRPADELSIYLQWWQRELERIHRNNPNDIVPIWECISELRKFDLRMPVHASLFAVEYVLPFAEQLSGLAEDTGSPVRDLIRLSFAQFDNSANADLFQVKKQLETMIETISALSDPHLRGQRPPLGWIATSAAINAAKAVIDSAERKDTSIADFSACKAVRDACIAASGDFVGVWNWISTRLTIRYPDSE